MKKEEKELQNKTKILDADSALTAAAPELFDLLKRFVETSANFNDKQFGQKYPDAAIVYVDAKELIQSLTPENE